MWTVHDTGAVPETQRVDYWRSAKREEMHSDCCIEPAAGTAFQARLCVAQLGSWKLMQVSGTPYASHRQGAGAPGRVSLMCQLEGRGSIVQAAREALLQPGDLCLVPPDGSIVVRRHGSFRQVVVHLPQAELDNALPEWRQLTATTLPAEEPSVKAAFDLVRFASEHGAALGSPGFNPLGACGMALFGEMGRAAQASLSRSRHSRLATYQRKRVQQFILDHLHEGGLNVAQIARELKLSVRYIHKLFETQGQQVMQWALAQRLEACRRELALRGSRPVSDIAYAWGFCSPAHFSRAFKRQFGLSPSAI